MPQKEARDEAIRRAIASLAADLAAESSAFQGSGLMSVERRCARLGLPAPTGGGTSGCAVDFPLFGSPAHLDLTTLRLTNTAGEERSQTDRILFYHYFASTGVLASGPVSSGPVSSGELISFRDLTGGAFYWEPFRSRTCLPLAKRYGADLPGLRAALGRFDWKELGLGDFGARVHGMGSLYLSLVCYAPEEGLDADIQVLFDPAMKRVFDAEDATAFASRICMGLL